MNVSSSESHLGSLLYERRIKPDTFLRACNRQLIPDPIHMPIEVETLFHRIMSCLQAVFQYQGNAMRINILPGMLDRRFLRAFHVGGRS